MMTMDLEFDISDAREDEVPVIVVRGEIDVSTAPRLRERIDALARRSPAVAVADLSAVTFVDSTALGVLVNGAKGLRSAGGDLRLVVTDAHVAKVLAITGLDDVFSIFPNTRQAVSSA